MTRTDRLALLDRPADEAPAGVTPQVAAAALAVMRSVSATDEGLDPRERALLAAVARLLGVDDDVDAIRPITPEAVTEAVTDARTRVRVVQVAILMALIDGRVTPRKCAALRRLTATLDVYEPRETNVHQFAAGRLWRMKLDVNRTAGLAARVTREVWREGGLREILHLLLAQLGRQEPALAWKYKQLGLLPSGTLGRVYWEHCTHRRLAFPGERGGFPERLAMHDMVHVLAGYDTDPAGEYQTAAFIAGFTRHDPFWELFMTLMQFHMGVAVFHNIPTAVQAVDPEIAARAFARGTHVRVDLYDHWDFWSVIERPVGELRELYGVLPA